MEQVITALHWPQHWRVASSSYTRVVQHQGGHTWHITLSITSSEYWNCSNSVNIWYFVDYMTSFWRSWQGCHFLAHPVYLKLYLWRLTIGLFLLMHVCCTVFADLTTCIVWVSHSHRLIFFFCFFNILSWKTNVAETSDDVKACGACAVMGFRSRGQYRSWCVGWLSTSADDAWSPSQPASDWVRRQSLVIDHTAWQRSISCSHVLSLCRLHRLLLYLLTAHWGSKPASAETR